jgi:hypothetical protein
MQTLTACCTTISIIPARDRYTSSWLMANRETFRERAGHRARLVGLDSCPKSQVMDVSLILYA